MKPPLSPRTGFQVLHKQITHRRHFSSYFRSSPIKYTELSRLDLRSLKPDRSQLVTSNGIERPDVISSFNHASYAPYVTDDLHVPGQAPIYDPPPLLQASRQLNTLYRVPMRMTEFQAVFVHAFAATKIMNPSFRFDDIHLLVGRGSLKHFFRLCEAVSSGRRDLPKSSFQMSVVGDTLIVQVWRPSDTSSSRAAAGGPASDFDYGKDFEKVVTRIPEHLDRPEFENHSRLVRYKLGNLDMAVLLNLDALYPGVDAGGASTLSWAEIKTTCKNERGENIQRAIVQQWFGRTSHLILGVHSRGFLLSTRVMDCTEQLLLWEKLHQESLQMMPALFSELRNIAKATEFKTITVLSGYGPSNDEPNLRIYAHNLDQGAPGFFLPKHLINQFWTPDPNGLDRRFA